MSGDHNSSYLSYDDLADQFATREPMLDDDWNPTEGWFFTSTDLYHFCEELVHIVETKTRNKSIATLRDMHQELFTMGTKVLMATGRGDTMLDGQAYGLKLAIEALEKKDE